jgi:CHC2 zinc finger
MAKDLMKCLETALLGFVPHSGHAGQQRGACPLHGTTSGTARCYSVNTHAHTFHCFKCGRSGNALDLWAAANGLSIYDAALDLCQRINIALPILTPPGPREQRRGNRSHDCKHLYNPLSGSAACHLAARVTGAYDINSRGAR